jgi:hypothetical protein
VYEWMAERAQFREAHGLFLETIQITLQVDLL